MKPRDNATSGTARREIVDGLDDRLLKIAAVMEIAGIGKTMIYRKVRDGSFPQPCKPGGTSSRWSEREVKAWRESVLAARQQQE